jgi:PKD repeat protein
LIEDLTGGIYNVHVNTGCSAFELVADVSDPNAVEASILVESVEVAMLDGEAIVEFVSSTTNASTLLWLVDGVEQSADAVFNFVFTEVGTHNVVLMASNEFCETSATLEIIVQSEANFIDNSSVVSITLAYVQDGVQLSLANLNGNGQLKVSNALGQTVDSIRLASGTEQYFMSTAGYSAGVYNLELVVEGERAFVAQFVK